MNGSFRFKVIITIFVFFSSSLQLFSQNPPPLSSRFFSGGNVGLNFGTVTYVDLSPIIGYKVTEKFSVGTGATYIYYSDNRNNYSTNIYGGRLFSRYLITENIFAHAEYELINFETLDFNQKLKRMNVPSLFVGGGYNARIAGNSFFNITVLWNVLQSVYTPYSNPLIRTGFTIGL